MERVEIRPCEPDADAPTEFGNADVDGVPAELIVVPTPLKLRFVSIIPSVE